MYAHFASGKFHAFMRLGGYHHNVKETMILILIEIHKRIDAQTAAALRTVAMKVSQVGYEKAVSTPGEFNRPPDPTVILGSVAVDATPKVHEGPLLSPMKNPKRAGKDSRRTAEGIATKPRRRSKENSCPTKGHQTSRARMSRRIRSSNGRAQLGCVRLTLWSRREEVAGQQVALRFFRVTRPFPSRLSRHGRSLPLPDAFMRQEGFNAPKQVLERLEAATARVAGEAAALERDGENFRIDMSIQELWGIWRTREWCGGPGMPPGEL
ncbi:hypothetical protein LOZ65_005365 [Ophidiomyces ophidiicola]|nr:hypothetical protein LOZ65_005365 [Ophidiomyces ophidiicola]